MSDFTTVDSSIISNMKRLSKEIEELEEMISSGISLSDDRLSLIYKRKELNELIEKL